MSAVRRWLPVVLFGAAVLSMSGPWASSTVTGGMVEPWFEELGFSRDTALFLHAFVRKSGHVAAYAVFGFLALRAVLGGVPAAGAALRRRAFAALLLGAALAAADEGLQSLTPERGGCLRDVVVDTGGVAFGVAAGLAFERRRASRAAGAPAAARPAPEPVASAR